MPSANRRDWTTGILESLPAMRFFKANFCRFFTIGFAAGALFVVATTETDVGSTLANGVIPVAEAQAAS